MACLAFLHTELKLFSTKAKQTYLNKKQLNKKFVILAKIHLEFKNKCSERLKMIFFNFWQSLRMRGLTITKNETTVKLFIQGKMVFCLDILNTSWFSLQTN